MGMSERANEWVSEWLTECAVTEFEPAGEPNDTYKKRPSKRSDNISEWYENDVKHSLFVTEFRKNNRYSKPCYDMYQPPIWYLF